MRSLTDRYGLLGGIVHREGAKAAKIFLVVIASEALMLPGATLNTRSMARRANYMDVICNLAAVISTGRERSHDDTMVFGRSLPAGRDDI